MIPGDTTIGRWMPFGLLVSLCVVIAVVAYKHRVASGPGPTYEQECRRLCEPLSSRVQEEYINPHKDPHAFRNGPRSVECLCGNSTDGKRLR